MLKSELVDVFSPVNHSGLYVGGTELKFESRNHVRNEPLYHFLYFLDEIWTLKSGCSQTCPTHDYIRAEKCWREIKMNWSRTDRGSICSLTKPCHVNLLGQTSSLAHRFLTRGNLASNFWQTEKPCLLIFDKQKNLALWFLTNRETLPSDFWQTAKLCVLISDKRPTCFWFVTSRETLPSDFRQSSLALWFLTNREIRLQPT